jgi:large subunit ribosomal protein L2
MALKVLKPITSGQRGTVLLSSDDLTASKPKKSLLKPLNKNAGRNSTGKITVRHRGGGHKKRFRIIDFKRSKNDVSGEVVSIEYDPNRSARIALIKYVDGDWRYVIATNGMSVGQKIISSGAASIEPGNSMPLKNIPTGTLIHNIEITLGKGGQMVRGAGTSAQLLAKEGKYVLIRLPSGETRQVFAECIASIGQVGAVDHKNIKLGKAGRKRNRGWRPSVRGVVMSPRDHPHGGGEGKSPIGMPSPKTPWGKPALGLVTRKRKRYSSKFIVKSRRVK